MIGGRPREAEKFEQSSLDRIKDTDRKENQFVVYKENIYVIGSNGELGLHKPFGIGAHSCFASFGLDCAIAYEPRDESEGPKMGELIIKCDQG